MVPFDSFATVSSSHCIATMAVYLAVSIQYTNVTDTHDSISRLFITSLGKNLKKNELKINHSAVQHDNPG